VTNIEQIIKEIQPLSSTYLEKAQQKLDSLTKPRGSLGKLEAIAQRYAAIKENIHPRIKGKRIFTFAGDHGVTEEGVSAFPKAVTVQMVFNMLAGGAAINALAKHVGAEVLVVDVGVDFDFEPADGLIIRKVGHGTRNFTKGPAMSRADAIKALMVGITLAEECAQTGIDIIGTGEMGIGNTTPSSAILSVLTGISPQDIAGRGTGVDDNQLLNKIAVIKRAIAVNHPDHLDPIDVLAKLGGYEIGAIAGLIMGGAYCRIPVVVDGFISTAGAMIATAMNPVINEYIFYSHLSAERGHKRMLEHLGQEPILSLDMRLGEGTGGAIAMTIIEGAVKIMNEMATFESACVARETRS
jgi:nicotinate-nucleotide--dimethylbenzimidazole phosphoribosyltransferase